MELIEFFNNYGSLAYALAIYLGGQFGMKFFPCKWKSDYKYLLFSTIIAGLFILIEHLAGRFNIADLNKYLFTYLATTTFYSLIGKKILELVGLKEKKIEIEIPVSELAGMNNN